MDNQEIKIAKTDMSKQCGFRYTEYWVSANVDGTMSQEEFNSWYSENCGKCIYMGEVCMYDESILKSIQEAGEEKCPCDYGICGECKQYNMSSSD